jgi:lysophospholipase L1-like esterase
MFSKIRVHSRLNAFLCLQNFTDSAGTNLMNATNATPAWTCSRLAAAFLFASFASFASAAQPASFKFDFGSGKVAPGYVQVLPTAVYSRESGFGFDLGSTVTAVDRGGKDLLRGDFCTSEKPFFFSVALPEGNYDVSVTLGDLAGESTTTVQAESRRLMLENVHTATGEFVTRTFTVNVRTPRLASGGEVRLKPREQGPPLVLHWDDKLTLEFNGARACVCALEITPATNAITVFLLGDSTVTDQPREPWNSWGQMLPRFFKPGVAVANHAESGESLRSSLGARRVEKVLTSLKRGDYVFVQFGHNDQKDRATNAVVTYKANLKKLVADTRERGATPVLVTSMERMAGLERDTLAEYPATVRLVAKEDGVALIDLHALSRKFYRALGGYLKQAFQDGTHHNNYGSYELAKCVVTGIQANHLPLAKFIVEDMPVFDPEHPDPIETFSVPPSPAAASEKPEGN